jgi:predicted lipid-binding transport protein (Tim44 family)
MKKFLSISFLFTLVMFLVVSDVFARAGGGGGSGGGGGIAYIILLPYLIVHSIIVTYLVVKKQKQCRNLMDKLKRLDSIWDADAVQRRIEETYFKVQDAWTNRDQTIAKDYMSGRLFTKHKMQTDQMLIDHKRNVLDRINLIESKIVEIADYKDETKDKIWVYIKQSMIDYMLNDETKSVASGDANKPEVSAELWKFIREEKQWVLDEIDQNVTIQELNSLISTSEEIK